MRALDLAWGLSTNSPVFLLKKERGKTSSSTDDTGEPSGKVVAADPTALLPP